MVPPLVGVRRNRMEQERIEWSERNMELLISRYEKESKGMG